MHSNVQYIQPTGPEYIYNIKTPHADIYGRYPSQIWSYDKYFDHCGWKLTCKFNILSYANMSDSTSIESKQLPTALHTHDHIKQKKTKTTYSFIQSRDTTIQRYHRT